MFIKERCIRKAETDPVKHQAMIDFIKVALNNDFEKLNEMISAGFDMDYRDCEGQTVLILACNNNLSSYLTRKKSLIDVESKVIDVVALLLGKGANPNLSDSLGKTAMDYAKRLKFSKIVNMLESASEHKSLNHLINDGEECSVGIEF